MNFFDDTLQHPTKNDKNKIKYFIVVQKCKFTQYKSITYDFQSIM